MYGVVFHSTRFEWVRHPTTLGLNCPRVLVILIPEQYTPQSLNIASNEVSCDGCSPPCTPSCIRLLSHVSWWNLFKWTKYFAHFKARADYTSGTVTVLLNHNIDVTNITAAGTFHFRSLLSKSTVSIDRSPPAAWFKYGCGTRFAFITALFSFVIIHFCENNYSCFAWKYRRFNRCSRWS